MPSLTGRIGTLFRATRERLPWSRLSALYACVTIGFSQIIFTLIVENQDYFPGGAWFYFWVLVWVQLVPFAVVAGLEAGLVALWGRKRIFNGWRAALYTTVFLSFLRQIQIHHPKPFLMIMERIPLLPIVATLSILFLLLCFRFHRNAQQYFGILGILALVLAGSFVVRSGVVTRDWRDLGEDTAFVGNLSEKPHIFLIVFDELSADILLTDGEIDAEAFPNFAALARESSWFPDTTTNHQMTYEAVPTLLSGVMNPDDASPTVFDRLPPGYEVWISTGNSPSYRWLRRRARENFRFELTSWVDRLITHPWEVPSFLAQTLAETPISHSPFGPQPAQRLLPPHMWKGVERDVDHQREVEEFLALFDGDLSNPRFMYWHCWYPHFPFLFDADGRKHGRDHVAFPSSPFRRRTPKATTPYSPEAVLQNYRDQVRFADSILGRLIEKLRERDLYDRSILIVTSDHGVRTWGDLDPDDYPKRLNNWTPRVPLFIRAPGAPAGRNGHEVQLKDVTATILDLLGRENPAAGTEGLSAFSTDRPPREKIYDIVTLGQPQRYVFDPESNLWVRRSTEDPR